MQAGKVNLKDLERNVGEDILMVLLLFWLMFAELSDDRPFMASKGFGQLGFASAEIMIAELMELFRMVHFGEMGQFVTDYEPFQILRQECEQCR